MGADAQSIFNAAVRRVQADQLMQASDPHNWAPHALTTYDEVRVVGMGKAAMAMAGVLEEHHPDLVDGGAVVVPEGYPERLDIRIW